MKTDNNTYIHKLHKEEITLSLIESLFYTHQMYEQSYENSLFKKTLSHCLETQSVENLINYKIYLMKSSDDIIGLSLVKALEKEIIPLFKLKDEFRSNSKIGTIYDKEFVLQDWFQIYIKPQYRNSGLATSLLHFVEEDLISSYNLKDNQLPLIVGKGLAHTLIDKKSKYFFSLPQDKIYSNKVHDLSGITRKVIDYVFEPVGHKFFLHNFNQQFNILFKEDKKNQLKNTILGVKKKSI